MPFKAEGSARNRGVMLQPVHPPGAERRSRAGFLARRINACPAFPQLTPQWPWVRSPVTVAGAAREFSPLPSWITLIFSPYRPANVASSCFRCSRPQGRCAPGHEKSPFSTRSELNLNAIQAQPAKTGRTTDDTRWLVGAQIAQFKHF